MKWKLWLEIIGMATALSALVGIFGILINVFIKGQYFEPIGGVFIIEPHVGVLLIELGLVVISIPVMIYIGIKDIKGLARVRKEEKTKVIEEQASHIFLTAIFLGITLAFIVGLIVYVDDMSYQNEKLKKNIRTMDRTMSQMNGTIHYMEIQIEFYEKQVENLTSENELSKSK